MRKEYNDRLDAELVNKPVTLTRFEILCLLHKVQGGTIHQFNMFYKVDFLSMSEDTFNISLQMIRFNRNKMVELLSY